MFFVSFILSFAFTAIFFALLPYIAKFIVPYVIVNERECHILVLWGNIKARFDEPGFHILMTESRMSLFECYAFALFGQDMVVDTRLDQCYLRSLPVNSEEGAPMGIGVWYEMRVSDPAKYSFENADPEGSLRANVSNATVRCLSNLTLSEMMEDRHMMSRSVRKEVSPLSNDWGYRLGSVYIRNVHFRDRRMISQIEEKVVNRLRQVTAAIKQDGDNRVSVIRSEADRKSAVEFAKAAAIRPQIVGQVLGEISQDNEVASALFDILETEKILEGNASVSIIPAGLNNDIARSMMAVEQLNRPGRGFLVPKANNNSGSSSSSQIRF
ncbi:MAG: SPFH domain-containing protein [Candidatus Bruticola sp.]